MATPAFNRGLCDAFVEVLNNEYEKGGWWRNLVDDAETFVAIREKEVHIYYRGQRLLQLKCNRNGLSGYVHYKFLNEVELKRNSNGYVKVLNVRNIGGSLDLKELDRIRFKNPIVDVQKLKNAAKSFAKQEKSGVHDIIHNKCNSSKILDVEIRFRGYGTKQPDLAALCTVDEGVEVRFYEAKHFSNHRNLRKKEGLPKVVEQVGSYSKFAKKHHSELEESYRRVCRNLVRLRGIADRLPKQHELLKNIADGSAELRINPDVWLIVFGFDLPPQTDQHWKKHERKLCVALNGRLLMEGDPKDLKLCS